MSSKHIGEYIGYDGDFKCAFWTTYSIDFSTAYFIINQHIRPLIDGQPCHIMMDIRKAHESCQEDSDLKALGKLQSRAVISACDRKVAFHPKLLFLAGDSRIRLLVMSGNVTPSGILSNTDLIARFDYDYSEYPYQEIQGIIAEAFKFIKDCEGWHPNAIELLERVQTCHPWLLELESELFLGTHKKEPLFEQMIWSLGKAKVKKIEIYSPFYDPNLAALMQFRERFPAIPIEAWVGTGFIESEGPLDISQVNKLGISLYCPLFNGRDSFHAKVYRFLLEGESVVFWGSANCSHSALLSTKNSSEVLVKSIVSDDDFSQLFDPLPPKLISKSQVRPPARKDEKIESILTKISAASIDGEYVSLTVSDSTDFLVRVLGSNGPEMASKILSAKLDEAKEFKVDIAQIRFKVLAVELVDGAGVAISNRFPLSNLGHISPSSGPAVSSIKQEVEEGNPKVIHQIEKQYFVFERDNGSPHSTTNSGQGLQRDFWKSPRGSRSTLWGAGYPLLSYVAQSRLIEEEAEDEKLDDSENKSNLNKRGNKSKKEIQNLSGWPWAPDLEKMVARNHRRLLKSIAQGIKPDEDRWTMGLEHFVRHLIKPLTEHEANMGEDSVNEFADILLYVSQMIAYFTNAKGLTEDDLGPESVKARLTAFAKVIDFCYFFSTLDVEIYCEFHSYSELRENYPHSIQRQTRAGFLKTWIYANFPLMTEIFREQSLIDIEEGMRCVIRTKAAERAFKSAQDFCGSIGSLPIRDVDEGIMLNHPKYGPLLVESWFGDKADCISLLGETRRLSTHFFSKV